MQAAQFSIGRDVKGDKNKRKGGGETSVCREHLIGKPNWKVCELLHDITANVIRAGQFPVCRAWSEHQMMFFAMTRLHTRVRSAAATRNRHYGSTTTRWESVKIRGIAHDVHGDIFRRA